MSLRIYGEQYDYALEQSTSIGRNDNIMKKKVIIILTDFSSGICLMEAKSDISYWIMWQQWATPFHISFQLLIYFFSLCLIVRRRRTSYAAWRIHGQRCINHKIFDAELEFVRYFVSTARHSEDEWSTAITATSLPVHITYIHLYK